LPANKRLALLPERLVGVHPAAVVPKQRLGHETGRLAVLPRHVLDHILEHHHGIGRLDQRVEPVVDLRLPGRGHFVVLPLDVHAQLLHHQAHLGADVLLLSAGGTGKYPSLCRIL
jgi:hypothetical protein